MPADQIRGIVLHGIVASYDSPEPLLDSARQARTAGFICMDAYSPMPVEGLAEAIGFQSKVVSRIVLIAGLVGAAGGFALMWWITVVAYPLNVAGRPLNSWPAYIPITFECMVLVAAIAAVVGMLASNGLPQPYHPMFNVAEFELASRSRFFLCIEASDPSFDPIETRRFLERTSAREVFDVPA